MKRKLIAVLVANAFVGSAIAADGAGLKWTGEVGVGLRYVNESARDDSKLREYRDLDTDPVLFLDLKGDSDTHRFNFFVENVTGTETFTDEEIAAGRWLSEETYGLSGKRWLMLSAASYSCPDEADCAEGFSNVLEFTVPSRTTCRR